jgi:hypothetical protein
VDEKGKPVTKSVSFGASETPARMGTLESPG